jgi:predicted Zn-dependent protease
LARAAALAAIGPSRGGRDNTPLPVGPLTVAMSGDVRQAQLLLEEVGRRNPNNLAMQSVGLPVVRAAIALRANRPDEAVELLEPARAYEAGAHFWPNYLRGRAWLDLRRGVEAAAEFQKIIDHRGWDPTSLLWPLAHLGLVRASALQGDAARSRQLYDEFFALWREADADLPLLLAARREYEKLRL